MQTNPSASGFLPMHSAWREAVELSLPQLWSGVESRWGSLPACALAPATHGSPFQVTARRLAVAVGCLGADRA